MLDDNDWAVWGVGENREINSNPYIIFVCPRDPHIWKVKIPSVRVGGCGGIKKIFNAM